MMSPTLMRAAHANHSLILRQLGKVQQERAADMMGISGSTLSVFKTEYMERFSELMAVLGLKVVLETDQSLSNDEVWALRILAAKQLEHGGANGKPYGDLA